MGFFTSREFAISAVVAALFLCAGVVAVGAWVADASFGLNDGCHVRSPAGERVLLHPETTRARPGSHKPTETKVYAWEVSNSTAVSVVGCTSVGTIEVVPSDGPLRLTVEVQAEGTDAYQAVRSTHASIRFVEGPGGAQIAFDVPSLGRGGSFFERNEASVSFRLEVPPNATHMLDVRTGVGHVTAANVDLAASHIRTGVGGVTLVDVSSAGHLDIRTDVGAVSAVLRDVASGSIDVATDVGRVHLTLPRADDIGYAIDANADVGSITLDVDRVTPMYDEEPGAGGWAHGMSEDYATSDRRVQVSVTTDVGRITITDRANT